MTMLPSLSLLLLLLLPLLSQLLPPSLQPSLQPSRRSTAAAHPAWPTGPVERGSDAMRRG